MVAVGDKTIGRDNNDQDQVHHGAGAEMQFGEGLVDRVEQIVEREVVSKTRDRSHESRSDSYARQRSDLCQIAGLVADHVLQPLVENAVELGEEEPAVAAEEPPPAAEEAPAASKEGDFVHEHLAEAEVFRAIRRGLDCVILNPAVIIGPGDLNQISSSVVLELAHGNIPPTVPPGGVTVIDVRDVAAAHVAAAERGRTGERYLLGAVNLTHKAWLRLTAHAVGEPPCSSTQKPDGWPDITAMYCFPAISYVTTPPPIGPPV